MQLIVLETVLQIFIVPKYKNRNLFVKNELFQEYFWRRMNVPFVFEISDRITTHVFFKLGSASLNHLKL